MAQLPYLNLSTSSREHFSRCSLLQLLANAVTKEADCIEWCDRQHWSQHPSVQPSQSLGEYVYVYKVRWELGAGDLGVHMGRVRRDGERW